MSSRRGGAGAARMCRGASQRERRRRGAAIRLQSAPAGLCLFAALQSLSALSLPRARGARDDGAPSGSAGILVGPFPDFAV